MMKYLRAYRRRLWYRIFRFALRRLFVVSRSGSQRFCANRTEFELKHGPLIIHVRIQDTRKPDGYERTELLQMLREIRVHEARQGWKVPELEATPLDEMFEMLEANTPRDQEVEIPQGVIDMLSSTDD